MKKRILSILMTLAMCLSLMPSAVFAAEPAAAEETVTLTQKQGERLTLTPTGYTRGEEEETPFTGKYIITGKNQMDTPLDIINDTGKTWTLDITLDSAEIESTMYATALRLQTGGENSQIVLNLSSKGQSAIKTDNHPVFTWTGENERLPGQEVSVNLNVIDGMLTAEADGGFNNGYKWIESTAGVSVTYLDQTTIYGDSDVNHNKNNRYYQKKTEPGTVTVKNCTATVDGKKVGSVDPWCHVVLVPEKAKDGYVMVGWKSEPKVTVNDDNGEIYFFVMPYGDVTVEPVYEKIVPLSGTPELYGDPVPGQTVYASVPDANADQASLSYAWYLDGQGYCGGSEFELTESIFNDHMKGRKLTCTITSRQVQHPGELTLDLGELQAPLTLTFEPGEHGLGDNVEIKKAPGSVQLPYGLFGFDQDPVSYYEFTGWKNKNGGELIAPMGTVELAESATFVAQWEEADEPAAPVIELSAVHVQPAVIIERHHPHGPDEPGATEDTVVPVAVEAARNKLATDFKWAMVTFRDQEHNRDYSTFLNTCKDGRWTGELKLDKYTPDCTLELVRVEVRTGDSKTVGFDEQDLAKAGVTAKLCVENHRRTADGKAPVLESVTVPDKVVVENRGNEGTVSAAEQSALPNQFDVRVNAKDLGEEVVSGLKSIYVGFVHSRTGECYYAEMASTNGDPLTPAEGTEDTYVLTVDLEDYDDDTDSYIYPASGELKMDYLELKDAAGNRAAYYLEPEEGQEPLPSRVKIFVDNPDRPLPPRPSRPAQPDVEAETTTDKDGNVKTEINVRPGAELPEVLPMKPVESEDHIIEVNTNSTEPVEVTVPVKDLTPGQVVVVVKPDGTEEVLRKSAMTEDGLTVTVNDGDQLRIVDLGKDFADVPDSQWFKPAVDFVTARQLYAGIGGNKFGPREPMTRAMLAQVLYNLEGNPHSAAAEGFTDVKASAWYAGAVAWAAEKGVVSGYGNGLFGAEDLITREQLAVMLWNYAGRPAAEKELTFADSAAVSGYALEAVRWAVESGVMSGVGGNMLAPAGYAARAEVAAMLMNFMQR